LRIAIRLDDAGTEQDRSPRKTQRKGAEIGANRPRFFAGKPGGDGNDRQRVWPLSKNCGRCARGDASEPLSKRRSRFGPAGAAKAAAIRESGNSGRPAYGVA